MSKGMSPFSSPLISFPPSSQRARVFFSFRYELKARAQGDQYPRQWSVRYLWIIASFFPPYYRWVIFSKPHHFKINKEQFYSCVFPSLSLPVCVSQPLLFLCTIASLWYKTRDRRDVGRCKRGAAKFSLKCVLYRTKETELYMNIFNAICGHSWAFSARCAD